MIKNRPEFPESRVLQGNTGFISSAEFEYLDSLGSRYSGTRALGPQDLGVLGFRCWVLVREFSLSYHNRDL